MDSRWFDSIQEDPSERASSTGPCTTLVAMLERSFSQHRSRPACTCLGRSLSFGQIDAMSRALGAFLQGRGLVRGDRVAVMLPNVPQQLVTVAAVLRAGLVVVNVNPQLPAAELEHQLRDSGARLIVVIETAAATLAQVIDRVPTKQVVLAAMGDLLGPMKGLLVNHWMRRVQRSVPPHDLQGTVSFGAALDEGRRRKLTGPAVGADDIAALQYTGGTTGQSRGAVLLHRNLMANLEQAAQWYAPALARIPAGEQPVTVGALPLHHVFGFTLVMLLGLKLGAHTLLIPNPPDVDGMLKVLAAHRFHCFPAVNGIFQAVAEHPAVERVDWSALQLCVSGAVALESTTALLWLLKTGRPICQGYGLTEASPAVTCAPVDEPRYSPHIGLPLPGTDVLLIDDEGQPVPPGTPGEIAVRGPQVMAGYWQRPDETARVMTPSGHLRTGDIGVVDASGGLRLVDRKKDLIFVSGFNVYPNEIEGVLAQMPGVRDCAAVGVPDALAGEAVKVVLVKANPASASPSEADVRAWCETHLTGYKQPKVVEFRPELPRSRAGKVLRRDLRQHA